MNHGRFLRSILLRPRALQRRFASTHVNYPQGLLDALARGAAIDIHPEVQEALNNHRPLVALESAIITHGLPAPINLETARSLETLVRSNGAIPATIGIIGGRVKIGLDDADIERLADKGNKVAVKISIRDIGAGIALKKDGGTTCSATLFFAKMAGIHVFATGGLGGVHRGGENTLDISSDLLQLSKCSVALVSAGVKSILDIGRTLEYLETVGVPVMTYGSADDFPAFYSAKSGFKSPWRVDDARTAAKTMINHWDMLLPSGILIGVPIPEQYEAEAATIQRAVEQAIVESEENGMSKRGKEATPWLLGRIGELTRGKSISSNIALVENTAVVGSKISVEYARLCQERFDENRDLLPVYTGRERICPTDHQCIKNVSEVYASKAEVIVIGAAAIDITATEQQAIIGQSHLIAKSTAPGKIAMTVGGVGRNIAEAAHKILSSDLTPRPLATLLLSPIGDDGFARSLIDEHRRLGMRTEGFISSPNHRTAVCNMVLDASGALIGGVADMDIIRDFGQEQILQFIRGQTPSLMVMDGNLSPQALQSILHYCNEHGIATLFEPTSVSKSVSILPALASSLDRTDGTRSPITFASPNLLELSHIYHEARSSILDLFNHNVWWSVVDKFGLGSEWRMAVDQLARQPACPQTSKGTLSFLVEKGIAQMAVNLLPFFQHLVIKCGELGIIVAMRVPSDSLQQSAWASKRSNPLERYVVAKRSDDADIVVLKHFPALAVERDSIINVTGAGDSLVGSLCAGLVKKPAAFRDPKDLDALVHLAQEAAVLSLQSEAAVSPLLGRQ